MRACSVPPVVVDEAGTAAALHGGLDGLTPGAPFGPLRLQTKRAMRDLRDTARGTWMPFSRSA